MKRIIFIFLLVYQIPVSLQALGPIFTLFIRQYPEPLLQENTHEKLKTAAQKISFSRKIIKKLCPRTNQGVIATYGGYFAVSDYDGQLRFPRLHQKPNFTLIITPHVKPIFMIGNTIHHWELIPGVPYSAYSINREQDRETKIFYWDVKKLTTIKNNIVPFKDAITLYAKPSNIFVPEGITLTSKSPNLVLPQIFARKNRSGLISALNFLKNRIFFGKITEVTKKDSDVQFSSQIVD